MDRGPIVAAVLVGCLALGSLHPGSVASALSGASPIGEATVPALSRFHEEYELENNEYLFGDAIAAMLDKESGYQKEYQQSEMSYEAALYLTNRADDAGEKHVYDTPNACQTAITGSESMNAQRDSDITAKSITAVKTRVATDAFNSAAEAAQVMRNHRELYCSQESEARGRCTRSHNAHLQDADSSAGTILGAVSGDTMDFDQYVAANHYIDMTTNPVPHEVLPLAVERTPAGQRYLMEQRIAAAQGSMAKYSLAKIVAQRRPKNE